MICRTATIAMTVAFADGARPPSAGWQEHDSLPVRCHWEREGWSDRCEWVLSAVTPAWSAQVDRLGFAPPVPDDDGILDIYVTTSGTWGGAYVDGSYEDADPTDGRMGCSTYMALDPSISEAEMPAYIAHEFNHVLQFATDFAEPSLPVWEATATAAEIWTDPDGHIVPSVMQDFQDQPWMGLLGDGYIIDDELGIWSEYEYGAVLWLLHLDRAWGDGDGLTGPALWWGLTQEGWTNEPDVIDAYDALTGGWEQALMELSVQRARLGTPEAPDWGMDLSQDRYAVGVVQRVQAGDMPVAVVPDPGPVQTGVSYVEVVGLTAGQELSIQVEDAGEQRWGLLVVDGEEDEHVVDATELRWTATGTSVLLGAVNLGRGGWDADHALRQAEVTLYIGGIPEEAGDTGAVVEDTAAPAGDSGDAERTPTPGKRRRNARSGCGCTAAPPPGLLLAAVPLLVAIARRQR